MDQGESAVLIAEDNEDIRELVALQLRRMGVSVLQAENGSRAIDVAMAEHPALVLMDMDMPVMSGFEAVERLRSQGFTAPILAMTGYQDGPEAQRALTSGCDGLVGKPICSDVLRAQVQRALARTMAGARA
jgi:CheY-like chemotaxis protein